jgi:hypothetical protein
MNKHRAKGRGFQKPPRTAGKSQERLPRARDEILFGATSRNEKAQLPILRVASDEASIRSPWPPDVPMLNQADPKGPDRALQEQIERYRQMTGEPRLAIALELHELSCNVPRERIRHQHPEADEAEVERLLRKRLQLARR